LFNFILGFPSFISSCGLGFMRTRAPIRRFADSNFECFVMPDSPKSLHGKIAPIHAERMHQWFGRYGSFLQLWQTFELLADIIIMRELKLTPRHTSLVCADLFYATKANIALTLLNENKNKNADCIEAFKAAQSAAERNDYTHSILSLGVDGTIHRIRRSAKQGKYNVEVAVETVSSIQGHSDQFAAALEKASKALNITPEDVDAYVAEIESHASKD
jgi:hypothetical protein